MTPEVRQLIKGVEGILYNVKQAEGGPTDEPRASFSTVSPD